jgi:hypothetical protein
LGGRAIVVSIVSVFDWQRGYRICVHAVMSHHTHVVVCVDKDMADGWSLVTERGSKALAPALPRHVIELKVSKRGCT